MIWFVLLMLGGKQAQGPVTADSVNRSIMKILEEPAYRGAVWGVSIHAPLRNKTLFTHNGATNLRPASTMKVLTTMLAFDYLGPDYTFQTVVGRTGPVERGVLHGDLVVHAGGDPSFSGRYTVHWRTQDLMTALVGKIKAAGIQKIEGNILADLRFFDDVAIPKSWEWDDIGGEYGVPVSPLSMNDGLYQISLVPVTKREHKFEVIPYAPGNIQIINQTRLARKKDKPGFSVTRVREANTFTIRGAAGSCRTYDWKFAAWDPASQYLHALRAELEKQGITVSEGFGLYGDDSPISTPVCTWESDSIRHLGKPLMKLSQNHYADCFLKTVAREVTGTGSFGAGAKLANQFLAELAPDLATEDGQQIIDGSGLSSHNNLKPAQLVAILKHGYQADYRDAWIGTFPVMGVDGTVRRRGSATTKGFVWAKTGYINRTRTLAGYVETESGEPIIFALMANNYSCSTSKIESAQDRICALLRRLKPNDTVRKKTTQLYVLSKAYPLHAVAQR